MSLPDVIYRTACRIIPSAARVLSSAASSSVIDGLSYSKQNELWAYLYMPQRIRDTKQCSSLVTADSSLSEVIWAILPLISSPLVRRAEGAEFCHGGANPALFPLTVPALVTQGSPFTEFLCQSITACRHSSSGNRTVGSRESTTSV